MPTIIIVVPVAEGSPGTAASQPGRCGVLAAQTPCRILHHLAPLVFGDIDDSDEGDMLGLHEPHFEEPVVEPTQATGARLLNRLGPPDAPSLHEYPSRRHLALHEHHPLS